MPISDSDSIFLNRCYDLGIQGGRQVRPNPRVGCVLTYDNVLIGEGYHKQYGSSHAEVIAFASVAEENKHLLSQSTVYVSLAPCCHYGKTPPCTSLIIKHKIKRVVIAFDDPSDKVNQKSIDLLRSHGVTVDIASFNPKFKGLVSEFVANNIHQRPFIQIKFAKSKDGFIGQEAQQVHLSNSVTNIYTHKLRDYTDAILIGTNTAAIDNPSLTLRNHPGRQPLRVVLDRKARLDIGLTLLSDDLPTLIISEKKRNDLGDNKKIVILDFDSETYLQDLLTKLFKLKIYHLMVEGGAALIRSFVKANLWDEAVIINTNHILGHGVKAPNIHGQIAKKHSLHTDNVYIISNNKD